MFSIFQNSRSRLIVFITITLALFLMLSAKFWSDAYQIREQTIVAQKVSEHEDHLFELANSLATERAMMYKIANADELTSLRLYEFDQAALRTDRLIKFCLDWVVKYSSNIHPSDHGHGHASTGNVDTKTEGHAHSMGEHSHGSMHTSMHTSNNTPAGDGDSNGNHFADSAHHGGLRNHVDEIEELFGKLIGMRLGIKSQFTLSDAERDPGIGMGYFHVYNNLIESIGAIRQDLGVEAGLTNPAVAAHRNMKQSIWELSESTAQMSALINGVRLLSGYSVDDAVTSHYITMLNDSNYSASRAWRSIDKSAGESLLNPTVHSLTHSTVDWYNTNYKPHLNKFSATLNADKFNPQELDRWLFATEDLHEEVETLRKSVTEGTIAELQSAGRRATYNLMFDSVLVFLSLVMAIASLWYFKRVHKQAHQDELTGLDNRRMFAQRVSHSLHRCQSEESDCALLNIDLDRFKHVNDTLGHAVGDALLQEVADRLRKVAGGDAILARLGGDEFALMCCFNSKTEVFQLAKRINVELAKPLTINECVIQIDSSIGISYYPEDADDVDGLLKTADLAMYGAKKSDHCGYLEYHSEMVADFEYRSKTEAELRAAIAGNQFELYFQPQYRISESSVQSVEALIRWQHPERGLVPPDRFIGIAEDCGLMPMIGEWVLDEACRQASEWINDQELHLRVAVNVSPEQFAQADFVDTVRRCLNDHKLDARYLEIELTESVVMHDITQVVASLNSLRKCGIHIALDDFGTGYSSLSYLQDLPLDTLKIDRSFIRKLGVGDTKHDSITKSITSLASSLDLDTVAEGVETEAQKVHLKEIGITHIQGYYFSKPVPANDIPNTVSYINGDEQLRKTA